MPKRDIYHEAVKRALQRDGWEITHDPFTLQRNRKNLYADLGAERLISAEKGHQKIVVEIKSFVSKSDVKDLEQALGQYVLYQKLLEDFEPERRLYLAVTTTIFNAVFKDGLGDILLAKHVIRVVVFHAEKEVITAWIPD